MRKNYEILMPIVHDIYIQTKLIKGYQKNKLLQECDIERLDYLVNRLMNIIMKID